MLSVLSSLGSKVSGFLSAHWAVTAIAGVAIYGLIWVVSLVSEVGDLENELAVAYRNVEVLEGNVAQYKHLLHVQTLALNASEERTEARTRLLEDLDPGDLDGLLKRLREQHPSSRDHHP